MRMSASRRTLLVALLAYLVVEPTAGLAQSVASPAVAEPDLLPSARVARASATLPFTEVDHALLPATRDEALPDRYVPPDLVTLAWVDIPGVGQIRAVVVPDLAAMVRAARQEGAPLRAASAYRSYGAQVAVYGSMAARFGEEAADRRSARPGHSQHQLGTAIDFGPLGPAFAATPAGIWLWDHAHEHGFVFPYTPAAVERTGYTFEAWHVRWVGRELAQLMWEAGYQHSEDLIADDYVALARATLLRSRDAG